MELEKIDIKILIYIKRKKSVAKEKIEKKFGETSEKRMKELIEKKYIFEHTKKEPSGFPPPHEIICVGIGVYSIAENGKITLENYAADQKEIWVKFWIPIIFSLIMSAAALAVAVLK